MKILSACARCILLVVVAAPLGYAQGGGISNEVIVRAEKLMQSARSDNIAHELVTSLTTEVGPRLAGTEAEARARLWAVSKLRELGFHNVREEAFELPLWLRGEERAEILSPFPQALTITTLGGSSSTGPDGVEGEVVVFSSLSELRRQPAGSLAGKIVYVDEVMARSRDGSGYALAVGKRRETAYLAQSLGARAALIRSVGTSRHRFAHTGQMRRVTEDGATGVPTAALTAPDADQLSRALKYGKPVTMRLVITPRQLPAVSSGNVIAEITGREKPEEIVLVGAHLDSWDQGTGAVDDGAGVGIVVAAAKALLDSLEQAADTQKRGPRRTVRIVLFGSEEVGLVGARAYAESHANSLGQHIVATESDFGAGDVWRFDTRFGEDKLEAGATIARVLAPLGIESGNNTAYGGPDIKYLREAGVPVVTLVQDGSDYFDLHHTPNDTMDKIAAGDLDQNVAAYAAFLLLVAESDIYFR